MYTDQIAEKISNWNMKDIRELRDMIRDYCEAYDNEEFPTPIDMFALPTTDNFAHEKTDIAGYPVWAVDANGDALVGEDADDIQSIENVRAYYANK